MADQRSDNPPQRQGPPQPSQGGDGPRIRVTGREPKAPKSPAKAAVQRDPLVLRRHRQLRALLRQRLGFWRSLGRSNRWFPRKLVVTTEGKWIIGIALLLGAAAVNTGNNLLYLMLSLVISVISVSGLLSEANLRELEVRRRYPREVVRGEATPLRLEVCNDKKRAALHIEVGEVLDSSEDAEVRSGYLLHLEAGETGQAFAALRARRRGPIATVGLQIATGYPFGFAKKARLFDDPAEFLALPEVKPLPLPWRGAADHGASELSRRVGVGDSFAGLRDARAGDALRDIHWKVSARRGRLIAREWQAQATRVAVVRFLHVAPQRPTLATPCLPQSLDPGCAAVAGLCDALLRAGFAVGLQTLDGAVAPAADPGDSGEILLRLRRHLAQLLPADAAPPPQWPLPDDAWAQAWRQAERRAAAIASQEPLAWAATTLSGPAEVFLVTYAERGDAVAQGGFDSRVVMDQEGSVVAFEGGQRPGQRGAAA